MTVRRRRASWLLVTLFAGGSLAINVAALWGLGELVYARKWEPPEVETITYLELQPDRDEPDAKEEPEPEQPREPLRRKKLLPKPKPLPEIPLEELPEPEKQPEKQPEPEPEKEEPTEKVDFVLEQLKMVEQPDELDEQDAPDDVEYLSNINRDVQEQTRAAVTNLEQDAIKPQAAQQEPTNETTPGVADQTKIAQQREQPSLQAKTSPPEPPAPQEQRPNQQDPRPDSLLAMRDLEHRDHHMAQDEHEALASESNEGELQKERDKQASITKQNAQARIDKNDQVYRFRPRQKDLMALLGKDLAAPKRDDGAHQSKTKGVWNDVRNHYQSPLENMVPEVKVGNQTALRSRKHPFARFIAQMHRSIHDAWAWGFLEQLDGRGRNHPLNDFQLWTRVEIVLNRDGTIDKVKTVHFSGNLAFDAAAREIVYASGPFPDPPREIMSGNGKIYVHWAFHRDERACGTFGAQPFILDNAGQGDRPDPNVKIRGGRSEREDLGRRLQRKPTAPSVAEGPAAPGAGSGSAGGGSGAGHDGHEHGSGGHGDGGGGGGGDDEAAKPAAGEGGSSADVDDPAAKRIANEWLHYFAVADLDKVASRSSLPFSAGDTVAARTREELRDVLATMTAEAKAAGRPKAAKMYTAAALRKLFGSVPAGVQEGGGRVYALTKVGGEYVILVLEKKFGSWRVVGVTR